MSGEARVEKVGLILKSGGRATALQNKRWRVSEWGTGLELMQEWKFGLEGKGCVCMEI